MSSSHAVRGHNHEAVMAVLEKAGKPLTAYEILECLRPLGISSPPSVYRALDRLLTEGRIHRLESLNAFVPCCHGHSGDVAIFAICDACGGVEEITDVALEKQLAAAAEQKKFTLKHSLIEMHGQCSHCEAPARNEEPKGHTRTRSPRKNT